MRVSQQGFNIPICLVHLCKDFEENNEMNARSYWNVSKEKRLLTMQYNSCKELIFLRNLQQYLSQTIKQTSCYVI